MADKDTKKPKDKDQRQMDEVLRKMLQTPPKPDNKDVTKKKSRS